MKIYLLTPFLLMMASACAQKSAPIQSMRDIQPYLIKNLGIPTAIDTTFEGDELEPEISVLTFRYKNRPDLNLEKIGKMLSEGFGFPYVLKEPHSVEIVPLWETPWGIIYKVQVGRTLAPPGFIICILDDKGEIPIPKK